MFQNLDSVVWPAWNSAYTLTIHFRARVNAGTGAFNSMSSVIGGFPDNILIVTPGRDTGLLSLSAIYDSVVQTALNYGIASWYSPGGGLTVEESIRTALSEYGSNLPNGNSGIMVLFDGQFGRVLVSQA